MNLLFVFLSFPLESIEAKKLKKNTKKPLFVRTEIRATCIALKEKKKSKKEKKGDEAEAKDPPLTVSELM